MCCETNERSTPDTMVVQGDVQIVDPWLIQGPSHLLLSAVTHAKFCAASSERIAAEDCPNVTNQV